MQIICLDTPYSNYFNDLAVAIERECEAHIDKVFLAINPEFKIYCPLFRSVIPDLNGEVSEEYVEHVGRIKSLKSGTASRDELVYMAKVYVWIEQYVLESHDCVFIIYNDMRWHHALVVDICNRLSISYLVFERGVLRPHTTSIGVAGVNARSLFSKMKFTVSGSGLCNRSLFFKKRIEHKYIKRRFLLYLSLKALYSFGRSNLKWNSKGLRHYLELFLRQKLLVRKKIDFNPLKPFFFVPLQLEEDTQIIFDSDFNSMQEFIDLVSKDFAGSQFCESHILCFKKHPMDVRTYDFPEFVYETNADTGELVASAEGVVTINSTVGFEAIGKCPVVCLGRSFYTGHGLVSKIEVGEKIFCYENLLNSSDFLVQDYIDFVLKYYQLPGSVYNYTQEDILYSAEKCLKILLNLSRPKPTNHGFDSFNNHHDIQP